jgi:Flagellin and related hook-associated proteins
MALSLQTNVASLFGQDNFRANADFQARTIQRLTSGYRINSSGDDAAGLSVANKFRSDQAELQQGIRNANDGISTLQIVDGGLNNVSKILDRLKTLATESSSGTFTGDRTILNTEFQSLLGEINRQASNIGLSTGTVGGRFNTALSVYIGGGAGVQGNAAVTVDLSGNSSRVDSSSLGISSSSVSGGGTNVISGGAVDLRSGTFLTAGTQAFTFQFANSTVTATVGGGVSGLGGQALVDSLNTQIGSYGVTASINTTNGQLQFNGGSTAFNVSAAAASAGTAIAATAGNAANTSLTVSNGQAPFVTVAGSAEVLSFTIGGAVTTVSLAVGTTQAQAISQINSTAGLGVKALINVTGNGIDLQSTSAFTLTSSGGGVTGVFALNTGAAQTVTAPVAGATVTGNALLALSAISTALGLLGAVQGKVGTGQNTLAYAVNLATSQDSNFAAAESRIRDADVAAEAANLTKAQVLNQSSLAAIAQANSAPQAVLALLRG